MAAKTTTTTMRMRREVGASASKQAAIKAAKKGEGRLEFLPFVLSPFRVSRKRFACGVTRAAGPMAAKTTTTTMRMRREVGASASKQAAIKAAKKGEGRLEFLPFVLSPFRVSHPRSHSGSSWCVNARNGRQGWQGWQRRRRRRRRRGRRKWRRRQRRRGRGGRWEPPRQGKRQEKARAVSNFCHFSCRPSASPVLGPISVLRAV